MAYTYTLPNSTAGIDSVMTQIAQQESTMIFFPLLLLFVYFMVFLSGYNAQRKREGNADLTQWNVLASLVTLMIALLMSTIGLINLTYLSIVVAVVILSAIWYFFTRGRFE